MCFGDTDGDGIDDACSSTAIPTVSEWGLLVLTLLFLIGGKARFSRRSLAAH
jgi:hypothetical protein